MVMDIIEIVGGARIAIAVAAGLGMFLGWMIGYVRGHAKGLREHWTRAHGR